MNLPAKLGSAQLQTHPNEVWEYGFTDHNGLVYAHIYVQAAIYGMYRVRLLDHEITPGADRPHTYYDQIVSTSDLSATIQRAYTRLVDRVKDDLDRHRYNQVLYTKLVDRDEGRLTLLSDAPTLWERLA